MNSRDSVDGEGQNMVGQLRESDGESSDSEVSSVAESLRDPEFDCMDPLQHLAWAKSQPFPIGRKEGTLSSEQVRTLQKLAKNILGVAAHAKRQLQFWSKRKAELAAVNQSYRSTLKPSEQQVVGKLDLFLLQEMIDASQHVGRDYAQALAQGFAVTGDLDDGSLGVPIEGEQRVHGKPGLGGAPPLSDLKQHCRAINERTLRVARAKLRQHQTDHELLRNVWD